MSQAVEGRYDAGWYLEGALADGSRLQRVAISTLPFRIGRHPEAGLCIPSSSISKFHAEIYHDGSSLRIRDLGSTNGTFVNHRRAEGDLPLKAEDIVHFAYLMFRVGYQRPATADSVMLEGTVTVEEHFAEQLIQGPAELQQLLLDKRAVVPHFHPIVKISTGAVVGYEVLGRGNLVGLPVAPIELFQLASEVGLEEELSRLFRREGLRVGQTLPGSPILFVNTHPAEGGRPGLIESLRELRRENPHFPLTLEVHEGAVTDLAVMRELRAELDDLGIALAYDDFGAGQARLVELVEVPPDYLKFDMALVRDIHLAPKQKQQMVQALVKMVLDLGIAPLAEGIECKQEADVFADFGVDLAQGHLYALPGPASSFKAKETFST